MGYIFISRKTLSISVCVIFIEIQALRYSKIMQVYLSLYATIGYMVDSVVSGTCISEDSLSLYSLKVKVFDLIASKAYNI